MLCFFKNLLQSFPANDFWGQFDSWRHSSWIRGMTCPFLLFFIFFFSRSRLLFQRRLQRKRRHCDTSGIIDIRQEELTAGAEIEFTKTISQEEDEWSKKKHSEAMPSKMAARKHQITWLAYRVCFLRNRMCVFVRHSVLNLSF